MKIADIRRIINERPVSKKVNHSIIPYVTGTSLEGLSGVVIAYNLDEFINMIACGRGGANSKVPVEAEFRRKEGANAMAYSARFMSQTLDGKKIIYDETYARYRNGLHPLVTAETFEKGVEAESRVFVTIDERLKIIKERLNWLDIHQRIVYDGLAGKTELKGPFWDSARMRAAGHKPY